MAPSVGDADRGPGVPGHRRAPWSCRTAWRCSTARCGTATGRAASASGPGLETLGTTLGPYAGGWLIDQFSWRAVFLLSIPLLLPALILLRHVPETLTARGPLSLDIVGALLTVVGLGGVIYALTEGPETGWLTAPVLVAAAVGVAGLAVLWPAERRRRAPMLKLSLFASRPFDAINVMTVLFYGALGAASYLVFLQCELRLGYSRGAGRRLADPRVGGLPVPRAGQRARWSPGSAPAG